MKKEDPDNKQPEYTRYSEDEEQVLDLNELMDVQGGIDDKELSKCGLGCYTGGFVDPTKHKMKIPEMNKVYVLNPHYHLRHDIHRVALFSSTGTDTDCSRNWHTLFTRCKLSC